MFFSVYIYLYQVVTVLLVYSLISGLVGRASDWPGSNVTLARVFSLFLTGRYKRKNEKSEMGNMEMCK